MVKNNTVVEISYVLNNSDGVELESSKSGEPLKYLHGAGQIIQGLEKAINGLLIGDKKNIIVTPEDGYGNYDPKLKIKTSVSMFPKDVDVKTGMQFTADLGNGKTQNFTVQNIKDEEVFIDGNHPLAGQTLHYSIEVLSIRYATQEELQHGHVHGPGGHHH